MNCKQLKKKWISEKKKKTSRKINSLRSIELDAFMFLMRFSYNVCIDVVFTLILFSTDLKWLFSRICSFAFLSTPQNSNHNKLCDNIESYNLNCPFFPFELLQTVEKASDSKPLLMEKKLDSSTFSKDSKYWYECKTKRKKNTQRIRRDKMECSIFCCWHVT